MAHKNITYEDGVTNISNKSKYILTTPDNIITAEDNISKNANVSGDQETIWDEIVNEINNLPTFQDIVEDQIKNIIPDNYITDIFDTYDAIQEFNAVTSTEKTDTEKLYGMAEYGLKSIRDEMISTIIGTLIVTNPELALLALGVGAAGLIPEINQEIFGSNIIGINPGWLLAASSDIEDKRTLFAEEYVANLMFSNRDAFESHSSVDNYLPEENVAGFDESLLLNKASYTWFIENFPLSDDKYLPEENAAGFDESLLINGTPHIWIIERSPLPDESLFYNGINTKEDVFDEEDIEKIKDMMQEGSVVNHYTIAPKLSLSGTNINQSIDFKMIMAQLEKAIKEELTTAPEGVYRK